jgi:prepilin-type N-terminal cleavage/methylation domain-containing protein
VKQRGFSLLEILIVLAIIGILAGLIAVGSRAILRGQENRSSLYSMRQIFWQGASSAASRGLNLNLVRSGDVIQVIDPLKPSSSQLIRKVELSDDATLSLPQGTIATFSPTGKVIIAAANNPFTFTADGKTYRFTVSLIGEVRLEPL